LLSQRNKGGGDISQLCPAACRRVSEKIEMDSSQMFIAKGQEAIVTICSKGKILPEYKGKSLQSVINHWHSCPERLCNLHP